MSYFAVDVWGFTDWQGPPPRLVNQHVRTFTKPGQPGMSGLLMGVHGDPFDVELHAAYPDQYSLTLAENGYRFLVGSSPISVLYNNLNYWTYYQHKYLVVAVSISEIKRLPRQINSLPGGYDYLHGWRMKSRWTMIPVT